jgi:hypothetical protein
MNTTPIPGVTQPGTILWLNRKCVRICNRSEHGRLRGRRYSAELPVRRFNLLEIFIFRNGGGRGNDAHALQNSAIERSLMVGQ